MLRTRNDADVRILPRCQNVRILPRLKVIRQKSDPPWDQPHSKARPLAALAAKVIQAGSRHPAICTSALNVQKLDVSTGVSNNENCIKRGLDIKN